MRLFIAINFNNNSKAQLLKLRDVLRSRSKGGNFSRPENIHLTLAFLGECDARQTAAAKAALDAVGFAPFFVEINQIGKFRRYGGDLWWVGVKKNELLSNLHRQLAELLENAGFELESRKFSPHITIGREIITSAVPWEIEPFGEEVTSIELMKSERIQGKLTYTAIHRRQSQ